MKSAVQNIVDDNGVEISVAFKYDVYQGYEAEPGNPNTFVAPISEVELVNVLAQIGEQSIDLLPLLWPASKEIIISKLIY
jgi:hypothetical protein